MKWFRIWGQFLKILFPRFEFILFEVIWVLFLKLFLKFKFFLFKCNRKCIKSKLRNYSIDFHFSWVYISKHLPFKMLSILKNETNFSSPKRYNPNTISIVRPHWTLVMHRNTRKGGSDEAWAADRGVRDWDLTRVWW